MSSYPRARIDLSALTHNLAQVRHHAPHSRIWAVVKANAYGHGMVRVAQALTAADGLAVARIDEALHLRTHGITLPILVLEGCADHEALAAALAARLTLGLHGAAQIERLAAQIHQASFPVAVWLKVDTGMHRLGVALSDVPALIERLRALAPKVQLEGLMTHLANADCPDDPRNAQQCQTLQQLAAAFGLALNIGNSGGILALNAARTEWVRPGIMLYGGSPFDHCSAHELGLRPVMTLESRLIARHHFERGAAIGYGGTYRCPESMPVGVVAIGYGDGYPRHAPTGTPVLIHGQRVPLIGRVSMDMISVDLRLAPQAQPGDRVVLWGQGLPVEDIAALVGTINYELLCRLSPRVTLA